VIACDLPHVADDYSGISASQSAPLWYTSRGLARWRAPNREYEPKAQGRYVGVLRNIQPWDFGADMAIGIEPFGIHIS